MGMACPGGCGSGLPQGMGVASPGEWEGLQACTHACSACNPLLLVLTHLQLIQGLQAHLLISKGEIPALVTQQRLRLRAVAASRRDHAVIHLRHARITLPALPSWRRRCEETSRSSTGQERGEGAQALAPFLSVFWGSPSHRPEQMP